MLCVPTPGSSRYPLYFSVKMSEMSDQLRDMAQAIGILESELQQLKAEIDSEEHKTRSKNAKP